jgi:hypothetical protein
VPVSLSRTEAQYSHIPHEVSTAHWPERGFRIPNDLRPIRRLTWIAAVGVRKRIRLR